MIDMNRIRWIYMNEDIDTERKKGRKRLDR